MQKILFINPHPVLTDEITFLLQPVVAEFISAREVYPMR